MKRIFFYFTLGLFLTGCATTSEQTLMLKAQVRDLTTNLQTTENRVAELEKENADLSGRLVEQLRISKTLGQEKAARVEETGKLRQDTRTFLKAQIAFLREFSQKSDFLDYVGGELIDRTKSDEQNITLVDMKNVIASAGSLLGARGYFTSPCSYRINILRQVEESWFVVWRTEPFDVTGTEVQMFDFDVPVSVEKGDVIAYTFDGPVGVPYSKGTGYTLYVDRALDVGSKVSALRGKSGKRTYSIGVVGVFE